MNATRIVILCVAAIAAGAAAFLVRGMLGGGTQRTAAAVPAINLSTTDILVASEDIDPGRALASENVKWQPWPKQNLSPLFVTRDAESDLNKAVEGMFVRAPIVSGEPIATNKVVKSDSASFMSATLIPGKRAIAINISAEAGAGGFILPNDRVDVILTRNAARENSSRKVYVSQTILEDVRVLAIDQTAREEKDQTSVVGKTATLELSPDEAEIVQSAQAAGTLSLALRGLGETANADEDEEVASNDARKSRTINVIRYGIQAGGGPEEQ